MPGYSEDRYQAEKYYEEPVLLDLDSAAGIKHYLVFPGNVKISEFFYVVNVAAAGDGAVVSLESGGVEKATVAPLTTHLAGTMIKSTDIIAFECDEGTALAFKLKTALTTLAGDGFAGITYVQRL